MPPVSAASELGRRVGAGLALSRCSRRAGVVATASATSEPGRRVGAGLALSRCSRRDLQAHGARRFRLGDAHETLRFPGGVPESTNMSPGSRLFGGQSPAPSGMAPSNMTVVWRLCGGEASSRRCSGATSVASACEKSPSQPAAHRPGRRLPQPSAGAALQAAVRTRRCSSAGPRRASRRRPCGTRGAAASRARAARREHPGAAPRRGARQVGRNLLSHSRRQRAAPQLPLRVLGVRQPRHGKLEHDLGAQPVAPGSELVTVGIGQQPGEEL